ncbi:MAG TPA: FHA domain-containing protein [Candidatus Cybelea sp.]|jgi:pSer/pThr/pTyr-binding forkhead associated (FHA) protein|nr:FHA domain-containing protein [Candidatus Cybelea sp.]
MTAMLAVAADFTRAMRFGSLEITAALATVAVLASRPRFRAAAEIGTLTPMQVGVEIVERRGRRRQEGRPPFEIGRVGSAGIALADAEVSRRHARVSSHDGVVYVEDLKSRNGTFLNGRRITDAIEVREGDEIDVGTTRIVVTSVRPA